MSATRSAVMIAAAGPTTSASEPGSRHCPSAASARQLNSGSTCSKTASATIMPAGTPRRSLLDLGSSPCAAVDHRDRRQVARSDILGQGPFDGFSHYPAEATQRRGCRWAPAGASDRGGHPLALDADRRVDLGLVERLALENAAARASRRSRLATTSLRVSSCSCSTIRRTSASTSFWVASDTGSAPGSSGPCPLAARDCYEADLVAHSPAGDHPACDARDVLDVRLRSGRDVP